MKHVKGDVLESKADVIVHQVNCQGVMGAGLAKQIKEKYPVVFWAYKALCDEDKRIRMQTGQARSGLLGRVQVCYKENYPIGRVEDPQVIVNLFAQDRYGRDGRCYTDYDALRLCLERVNQRFAGKTVAVPYMMGCGLAGGDWSVVSRIIEESLRDCYVVLCEFVKEHSVDETLADASERSVITGAGGVALGAQEREL